MIGLVADDLTGACDSAAPFLALGTVTVTIWPRLSSGGEADCLAVCTETRDSTPSEARERTRIAVAHLMHAGATLVFKKVDSRLRGRVRAELEGALAAWPGVILLAPALPAEGRYTRGARQFTGEEVVELEGLVEGLPRVTVEDADADADLDRVAAAVLAKPEVLPAGSAGLAGALARRMIVSPLTRADSDWPAVNNPLALVGSKTTITAAQVEAAVAAGWTVRRRSRDDAVDLESHDALFLTGGGTAAGVIEALGGYGLEVVGEALPRVPVGRLRGGPHEGLTICMKSGGFGGRDAIDRALSRLCHRD
jgi:uncharacterized protein YgbK (DUF1537 family)